MRIKRIEGAVLYSGCPIDFGTLSTDEGTFMDLFAQACLKGCSEDQEYEIADLIENMIVFTKPEVVLGHMRVAYLYEVGDSAVDIDETIPKPEEVNCYAARRLAKSIRSKCRSRKIWMPFSKALSEGLWLTINSMKSLGSAFWFMELTERAGNVQVGRTS
jgi:hypothetical protein